MSIHLQKPCKVLVLDSEWPAGLETIQSLGRLGVQVHASATTDCLAFRSRYVFAKRLQPASNADLVAWINSEQAREGYDLIVPATERSLHAFLSPDILPEVRERAVLSSNESLRAALEKEETRQLALQLGIRVPHTRLVDRDSAPPKDFPVVLKPVNSKRVRGSHVEQYVVTVADSLEVWNTALREAYALIPVQEQEYVTGRGIGVEMLFEHGELRWSFLHERLHEVPLTGGGSSYRRSIAPDPALIAPAEKLLRALHWHGVAMVEFKQTPSGELYLVEINPRLWGSLALAVDAGANFPAGLLALASGTPLPPQPVYRTGYRTRHFANDIFWTKCNLAADHNNPILHTRPRLRSLLEYALPLFGRESWDHFDWRDLGIILRQIKEVGVRMLDNAYATIRIRRRNRALLAGQKRNLASLEKLPRRSLLFLCYGNICRSPLAAALAAKAMPGTKIVSAGFHERSGRPSPEFMQGVAGSVEADLSGHRSRRVVQQQIDDCGLIILMDGRNYSDLQREFPEAVGKAVFLGLFASPPRLEIQDPYGEPFETAQRVAHEIRTCVNNLALWMGYPGRAGSRGGDTSDIQKQQPALIER